MRRREKEEEGFEMAYNAKKDVPEAVSSASNTTALEVFSESTTARRKNSRTKKKNIFLAWLMDRSALRTMEVDGFPEESEATKPQPRLSKFLIT